MPGNIQQPPIIWTSNRQQQNDASKPIRHFLPEPTRRKTTPDPAMSSSAPAPWPSESRRYRRYHLRWRQKRYAADKIKMWRQAPKVKNASTALLNKLTAAGCADAGIINMRSMRICEIASRKSLYFRQRCGQWPKIMHKKQILLKK